jgi:hypothetical protein
MLAESDVSAGLRELAVVFRPPSGREDLDRMARVYRKALEDAEPFEFRNAVEDYLATGQRYWPTPAKLRAIIDEERRRNPRSTRALPLNVQYARWQTSGDIATEPCPVCGAVLQTDSANETRRPQVYHDHQIHYEAGVGYAGPRTGPVDARKYLLPVGSVSVTKPLPAGDTQ